MYLVGPNKKRICSVSQSADRYNKMNQSKQPEQIAIDCFDLVTCADAMRIWDYSWTHCPVCGDTFDEEGFLKHRPINEH